MGFVYTRLVGSDFDLDEESYIPVADLRMLS